MNQERQKKLAIDALAMPAEEREKYLSAECGNDSAAREHIQNRIAKVENFWAADGSGKDGRREIKKGANVVSIGERPGDTIDRYTLLEKIGEGGMGVVWLAEQRHPVQRKVALKIIKLGMDTAEVVVRFEAERQALAMMEHPNIASIIDGGVTGQGRPYFAMELVRGEMITCYCDRMQFALEPRLRLFIDVCRAVRHAHEKGVIHRDLKPSNVLVTELDDLPMPKVIDFGIAKAVSEPLTDRTLVTNLGQMIGTPVYMSPEQAETGGLDIDTRSDVYSLGVLLYELITGTTPLEKGRTRKASFLEIQRLICEEDADRPSHRITTLGKSTNLPAIAQHRDISPERLQRLVEGDLDWIIMKALAKDRTRRYQTASDLIADLERYLNHEAVTARPPSRIYKLKKSIQRNKPTYAALAAAAVVLAGGAGITIRQAMESNKSSDREAATGAPADGTALHFDGVDDYVSIPYNASLLITTQWTLSAWINWDGVAQDYQAVLSQPTTTVNSGISLVIATGGLYGTTPGQGIIVGGTFVNSLSNGTFVGPKLAFSPPNIIQPGIWTHIAVSYDGDSFRIYKDAIEVGSLQSPGLQVDPSSQPFFIGSEGLPKQNEARRFSGAIDEASVWNVARTGAEIAASMGRPSGNEPGLIAYYDFEDGTGSSVLTDRTANKNDGNLSQMDPATHWVPGCSGAANSPTAQAHRR